jgi:septum formation protein
MQAVPPMLVLASTSPYRRELLARLQLQFQVMSPGVEESPLPGEAPQTTALRLAEAKARAGALRYPSALVIGSDQVAELDGERLEKPGTHDLAVKQLEQASGRVAVFHTGVALLNASSGSLHTRVVPSRVTFRRLSRAQIEAYLRREQPYDCAGSAKSEGLGIALLRSIEGEDPTALIGLPLIALVDMLEQEGCHVV